METETTTNPVEGADTSVEDIDTSGQEVETEGQTTEVELDDEGNPVEPVAVDDSEEVEYEGEKYKVPKPLKDALLRQADYTRKTQEIAETRRDLDHKIQVVSNLSQAEVATHAELVSLDRQLQAYSNFDWSAAMAQANAAYDEDAKAQLTQAHMHFQQLKDQRGGLAAQYANLGHQRTLIQQQHAAKLFEEGRAALQRDVPEWNDDLRAKLITYATKDFGFSKDEVSDLEADPRAAKVLYAAYKNADALKKQQQANKHIAAQAVQPAAKVTRASAPVQGLDDRLSVDEWTRRREQQLRKRG